jgi:hypothetical protein
MSTPLKAVSGGTSRPSRPIALTGAMVNETGQHPAIDTRLFELDAARAGAFFTVRAHALRKTA